MCGRSSAGIAGVARDPAPVNPGSTYTDSFARSEYPAYPVLAPTGTSHPSQSYPSGQRGSQPHTLPGYGNRAEQYTNAAPQYQSAPDQRPYGRQGYDNEKSYPAPFQQPSQVQQTNCYRAVSVYLALLDLGVSCRQDAHISLV